MPGMAMSRIRHSVLSMELEARNSSADENAWAAKPNSSSRSGNDSRTDSSSSTTDSKERMAITNFPRAALPLLPQEQKTRMWLQAHHLASPTNDRDAAR